MLLKTRLQMDQKKCFGLQTGFSLIMKNNFFLLKIEARFLDILHFLLYFHSLFLDRKSKTKFQTIDMRKHMGTF